VLLELALLLDRLFVSPDCQLNWTRAAKRVSE